MKSFWTSCFNAAFGETIFPMLIKVIFFERKNLQNVNGLKIALIIKVDTQNMIHSSIRTHERNGFFIDKIIKAGSLYNKNIQKRFLDK